MIQHDSAEQSSPRAQRGPGRPPAHAGAPGVMGDTRNRVLLQARNLFMQRGYADVAVGEVAAAVGVTKPTLYYHFGDKEGLYTAVLCHVLNEVGGYIRQVTQTSLPLRTRLYELALGYFRHADYTLEPMLRDATELLGSARSALVWDTYEREIFGPHESLMREGVRRGELRGDGDARTLARAFLGLLDALTAPGGHLARTDAEHQATSATLVSLFIDGAGARSSERSVLSS
ncbi:MAG: TetR/AcrR family transcriptional regulator [Ktedonobacterales bacterium]